MKRNTKNGQNQLVGASQNKQDQVKNADLLSCKSEKELKEIAGSRNGFKKSL